MSVNPPPRPALRKAADARVHPAAPALVGLQGGLAHGPAPALPERADNADKGAGKAKSRRGSAVLGGEGKTAELVVVLPKAMRKRLKAKAAEHGFTPEEATFHLLRVWLDG